MRDPGKLAQRLVPLSGQKSGIQPFCRKARFARLRLVRTGLLVLLLVARWVEPQLCGQSSPTPFQQQLDLIGGLRERRLLELADWHCQRLLARDDWTDTQWVQLTIERMKNSVAQAVRAAPDQRARYWDQAEQTASEFLQQNPQNVRGLLVRLQVALTQAYRGELLQQELTAEMVAPAELETHREESLQAFRQASTILSEIEREVLRLVPERSSRTLGAEELTADDLIKLNNQIRLQIAIASIGRAQLYPPQDRLNRVDALLSVLQRLQEIQGQSAPHQPLWWEVQVLQVETYRLLRQLDDAQRVLDNVQRRSAEEELVNLLPDRWIRQRILLALDQGNLTEVMNQLEQAEKRVDRSPELELARLLAAKEFSQRKQGAEKTEWLNRAAQLSRSIESRFGGYWGRRAKLILIGQGNDGLAVAGNSDPPAYRSQPDREAAGAELDLLIGLAEQAERRERYDDALKAYERAIEQARLLAGNVEGGGQEFTSEEFTLGIRAAQLLEKMQQPQAAAERFTQLALESPRNPQAAAAHLRGCWNWGRWINSQSQSNPAAVGSARDRLIASLQQHLQTWPDSDTSSQAHFWLGNQFQSAALSQHRESPSEETDSAVQSDDWKQAFQHYTAVLPADAAFAQAIEQAGVVGRRWWEQSRQPEVARQIRNRLKEIADQTQEQHHQRIMATTVGTEFGILSAGDLPELYLTGIGQVLPLTDTLPVGDPWRNRLLAWRLVAATFEPDQDSLFADLLGQISRDLRWLAVADQGIAAVLQNYPQLETDQSRLRWESLIGKVLDSFGAELSTSERQFWEFRRVEMLIALQRYQQGLELLEGLERLRPNDARIKLRIARLMSQLKGDQEPALVLAQWRKLAAQLQPQSDGWFEARYQTALMLEKMGQGDEARKLLQYLQAIPPGWENSRWKPEFESLLKRL